MNPNVKLILVVRDPIRRTISDHMQVSSTLYFLSLNDIIQKLKALLILTINFIQLK